MTLEQILSLLINVCIALFLGLVTSEVSGIRRVIGFAGVALVLLVSASVGELLAVFFVGFFSSQGFLIVRVISSFTFALLASLIIIKARSAR